LKIKEIRIVGYGLLSRQSFANEAGLRLRPGDPYKRSLADASEEYLKSKYAEPNQNLEVTEDDQMTANNELIVTFNVLAYEQDRVTINGKEFRVAPVVVSFHS
jgi:outer membrane protein assembly factor BamA